MPDPVKHVNFGQGLAAYNAVEPVFIDGEIGGLQITQAGYLKTHLSSVGSGVTLVSTIEPATVGDIVAGNATLTTTSNVSIIAAPGSTRRLYITSISGSNSSATDVRVDIKDGTTIKISFFVAALGGGFSHPMPIPLRLTANTALQMALSAAVTDVRVSAQGYSAAS